MATTTNYSWVTPDDSNLVKDGAAAIRTLGSSIDSTLKTQIDAQIPDSIIDAKGDLIVGTANDTPSRLAVGSNTQVLSVDSSTASGLKWASVNDVSLTPILQNAYVGGYCSGATSDVTLTEDTTYYVPVFLNSTNYNRIGFRTSGNTWTGTGTVRLGIYNMDGTTRLPSTVLLDAGTTSATAANSVYEITINQTPSQGYYYLALNFQTLPSSGALLGWKGTASPINPLLPNFGNSSGSPTLCFTQSGVTGAFATAGTLGTSTTMPFVGLQIA